MTTNTVEGFFSTFKRGMKRVYQHCSEAHLHRYLAEFDFRYSNRVALGFSDTNAPLGVGRHRWQAPDISKGSGSIIDMPKKLQPLTVAEQSHRFQDAVAEIEGEGDLRPNVAADMERVAVTMF